MNRQPGFHFVEQLAFLLASVVMCSAQAWVPPRGEGDISVTYQNLYTRDHFNGDGNRFDAGRIRLQGLVQTLDFGVTDKLAVSSSLPLFAGKYEGKFPHKYPIDDGNYHGSLQNFNFLARYMAVERPLVLTPFVGFSYPVSDYEHFAHSAIGMSMWEVGLGFNAARRLDPVLPNAYFQLRYSYVITQQILGIRPNKSRIDTEFGYFLTPRLAVRALAGSQVTHTGLDFPKDFPSRTNNLWFHHDQVSAVSYLNLGGGVSYSITNSVDIFATMATSVWGHNGHALNTGLSAGASWSFRMPWARAPISFFQDKAHWKMKPNEMKPCH
jgi:hypothetical protein